MGQRTASYASEGKYQPRNSMKRKMADDPTDEKYLDNGTMLTASTTSS